jgi:methylmalonyl-CoA epimerase
MDRAQGLHHIALAVDDLPRTIEDLKGRGIRMIDELPREGVENTKIAFAHPKSTGKFLVEFVEGA